MLLYRSVLEHSCLKNDVCIPFLQMKFRVIGTILVKMVGPVTEHC